MSRLTAFLTVFCLLLCPGAAPAAETDFYFMADKWNKSRPVPGSETSKRHAIDESFTRASASSLSTPVPGLPVAPAIERSLTELVSSGLPTELEYGQSLLIGNPSGFIKYVATDENVVTLQNPDRQTLQVIGTGLGNTFVHAWDDSGRRTFALRVVQPKLVLTQMQRHRIDQVEKNRTLRLQYDNGRSATYTGAKARTLTRTSLDFTQNLRASADTPYGAAEAYTQTQKAGGKTIFGETYAKLTDGHIGPLRNFNATAGDARVQPELMVFPGARVRGFDIEHWDDAKRVQWEGFGGRENQSILGTLAPSILSKRSEDSFLSGGVLDYQVNDNLKAKAGYFNGYGRAREDELNRHGFGGRTEAKLGPHVTLENETDFDNEKFANKHALTARFEKARVRSEYRDVSKKFTTLIGAPSRQGEVGNLTEFSFEPSKRLSATGSLDIFRDRLIPNPEDPHRLNIHKDLNVGYYPCDDVNYALTFQDLDDTGRLGPTRQKTIGLQYNERFDFWGRRGTFFARYQYRASDFLTNSDGDYRNNQAALGFYVPLVWDVNFSIQKEWNALEEVEVGRYTHPSAVTYGLDWQRQWYETPFYLDARLRVRDEERTESPSSFMAGEDSTEFSGGITYRDSEDLELFLTGSLTQYNPESLTNTTGHRVEAQFFTGMRGTFDTGLRWSTTGSFEGHVFKDQNGDGTRQPYEPGLPGMLIRSSTGKETVTDSEGHYQLQGVSGKKVSLTLDPSKIPYGFVPTKDTSLEFDIRQNVTQRADFGLTPRSDVTGILFNDLNANKKYEPGEPGVPKVKVSLETGQTARSNAQGTYVISNVVAGDHLLSLEFGTLPEGYLPVELPKKNFTLYEGIRYELNFPLRAKRAVTGRAFRDTNGNGVFDAEEKTAPGVPVRLGPLESSADAEGWYLFDDVAPGSYDLSAGKGAPKKIVFKNEPMTLSGTDLPV